jgi:hypothetical protein
VSWEWKISVDKRAFADGESNWAAEITEQRSSVLRLLRMR